MDMSSGERKKRPEYRKEGCSNAVGEEFRYGD